MKTAIVTGVCGQDGAYLAKLLLEKGYNVIGWARRNASLANLEKLGINIPVVQIDICDPQHVWNEINETRPDEIYNLAAQSHVGMSFKNPMQTCAVNYGGYLDILLAARQIVPSCKIYQAGSSEMFGYSATGVCNEDTPFAPMSPYAISKVASYWAGVNARYEANQFVCNGILFNHESILRGNDFVTKKVANFVKNYGEWDILHIGNLDSRRDWGYAGDYVKAMYLMMQQPNPDNYVVATGRSVSVRELIKTAFAVIGKKIEFVGNGSEEKGIMDGHLAVEVDKEFYRPNDLNYLQGDASKAREILGWKPEVEFEQMIEEMIK